MKNPFDFKSRENICYIKTWNIKFQSFNSVEVLMLNNLYWLGFSKCFCATTQRFGRKNVCRFQVDSLNSTYKIFLIIFKNFTYNTKDILHSAQVCCFLVEGFTNKDLLLFFFRYTFFGMSQCF